MKRTVQIILIVCVVVLGIIVIAGLGSDAIEIPEGFAGEYITVDGVKIRYVQKGRGPDLLCIHGLPGSLEDWETVIEPLSARYRVTVYDRPGHGFSGTEKIGYNLDHNARTALGLIDALGLKDVIVVGHSYGGSIVMALAVRNPSNIRGFITLGGASYEVAHIDPLFRIISLPLIGRGLAALASSTVGDGMIQEGVTAAFRPNEDALPPDYMETRKRIFLQTKVICTLAREEIHLNPDLRGIIPKYGEIGNPFIIIHGAADLLVPAADSRKLDSMLSRSKLIILEGVGHQVQFVRPEILIRAIDEMRG